MNQAGNSVTEDSSSECQHVEKNDIVDTNRVHQSDDAHETGVLFSSSEERMSEVEESSAPVERVLIQASVAEEDKFAKFDVNVSKKDKILADNSVTEDSTSDCQEVEKNDLVVTKDVHQSDNAHALEVSSSSSKEQEEMSAVKESSALVEMVLIQASLVEEEMLAELDENIDNERGNGSQKASSGANPMPCETNPVAQHVNRTMHNLLRDPRYFDNPLSCHGCIEDDEYDKQKFPKKRRKPCYICADKQHDGKHCKEVTGCSICLNKGHFIKDCPDLNVDVDTASAHCLKCGNTGHDMFSCIGEYDCEDLQYIRCYICNEAGHLCCVENKAEEPREVACYNCGESGHFGSECKKLDAAANDLHSGPVSSKSSKNGLPIDSEASMQKTKIQKDAVAAESSRRKKSRNARRKKNKANQPTNTTWVQTGRSKTWHRLEDLRPCFAQPASNSSFSPASGSSYPVRGFPSVQISSNGGTQVPQIHPHPSTLAPHLIWNSRQGPHNPGTATQVSHMIWDEGPRGAPNHHPRMWRGAPNHHPRMWHPNAGTPTPPNPFYPNEQLPRLIWNNGMGTQLPQFLPRPSGNQNNTF